MSNPSQSMTKRLPYFIMTSALLVTAQMSHAGGSGGMLDGITDRFKSSDPWDVGLTVGLIQSPFVGGEDRVTLSPTRLKHGGLRLNGFAWPVYQQPGYNLYLGAGLDEWTADRDDSDQLQDMDELDRAINLRAGIATELAGGWVTAEIAKDLASAHEGTQAKLRYTASVGSKTHEIRPYLEAQWLSAELTDYYVGVNSNEVAAGCPQYTADDDYAIKAGVGYRRPLTESITFIGGLDVTQYGDEISNSPIIENDLIWGANVGLTYKWR